MKHLIKRLREFEAKATETRNAIPKLLDYIEKLEKKIADLISSKGIYELEQDKKKLEAENENLKEWTEKCEDEIKGMVWEGHRIEKLEAENKKIKDLSESRKEQIEIYIERMAKLEAVADAAKEAQTIFDEQIYGSSINIPIDYQCAVVKLQKALEDK